VDHKRNPVATEDAEAVSRSRLAKLLVTPFVICDSQKAERNT
jgi:hypothetical protein